MRGPHCLHESEDNWETSIGACFPQEGRAVLRGRDLLKELAGTPWMGLLLYGITGREFDAAQIKLFEGIWTISDSYPDPRLWNNRVAALAGTARSTAALAVGAATAISEASIYGRRPDIRAIDLLYRMKRQTDQGMGLGALVKAELTKYRSLPGYGRPLRSKDERIDPLMALAQRLGFTDGSHVRLAFAIEQALAEGRWRFSMNVAALCAALAADQGLSTRQFYHYSLLSFTVGILACHIDASAKPEGTLFPLRCARIDYSGKGHRSWGEHAPPTADSPC